MKAAEVLTCAGMREPSRTFLADSRFSEWLGNSSRVRLGCFGCLCGAGTASALVSASTVESLCTEDSSGRRQGANNSISPQIPPRVSVAFTIYTRVLNALNTDPSSLLKMERRRRSQSEHRRSTKPSSPRWTWNLRCPQEWLGLLQGGRKQHGLLRV